MKNCPFCNSPAHVTERPRGYRVECTKRFNGCPMNMRTSHHRFKEDAVNAWNTRHQEKPIDMSICTFNDGLFQVIIKDDSGYEVTLEGTQKLDSDTFNFVNEIAPACVFTRYYREL